MKKKTCGKCSCEIKQEREHELDLISETPIAADEIKDLILNRGLTIEAVIDAVVELNGFIGVGLIQLGKDLNEYCKSKI